MSQLHAWQLAGMAAFWIAFSLLKTNHGRADRRPPLSWWASFGVWMLVGAPAFGVMTAVLVLKSDRMDPLIIYMLGGVLWSLSWALTTRLPLIGNSVAALRERENRRLEKGLI